MFLQLLLLKFQKARSGYEKSYVCVRRLQRICIHELTAPNLVNMSEICQPGNETFEAFIMRAATNGQYGQPSDACNQIYHNSNANDESLAYILRI